MRMNPIIKAKWVAALRSKKYAQAKGRLHRVEDGKDTFCCLGVLCDLAIEEGVRLEVANFPSYVTYDAHSLSLPPEVKLWAGLDYASVDFDGVPTALDCLNDEGTPFEKIADLIERSL